MFHPPKFGTNLETCAKYKKTSENEDGAEIQKFRRDRTKTSKIKSKTKAKR